MAKNLGCPEQTPGKPNPRGHTDTQWVKDLRQELWALPASGPGDQGCNCGTVNLEPRCTLPTVCPVPRVAEQGPGDRLGFQLCDLGVSLSLSGLNVIVGRIPRHDRC